MGMSARGPSCWFLAAGEAGTRCGVVAGSREKVRSPAAPPSKLLSGPVPALGPSRPTPAWPETPPPGTGGLPVASLQVPQTRVSRAGGAANIVVRPAYSRQHATLQPGEVRLGPPDLRGGRWDRVLATRACYDATAGPRLPGRGIPQPGQGASMPLHQEGASILRSPRGRRYRHRDVRGAGAPVTPSAGERRLGAPTRQLSDGPPTPCSGGRPHADCQARAPLLPEASPCPCERRFGSWSLRRASASIPRRAGPDWRRPAGLHRAGRAHPHGGAVAPRRGRGVSVA